MTYATFPLDPQYQLLNPLAEKFQSKPVETQQLPNYSKTLSF